MAARVPFARPAIGEEEIRRGRRHPALGLADDGAAGLPPIQGPPAHVCCSPGVDVEVFGLKPAARDARP